MGEGVGHSRNNGTTWLTRGHNWPFRCLDCLFLLLKRCFVFGIMWLLGFTCLRCWKVKILVLWSSPSLDAETPTTLPRSFSHSEKFNIVNAMQWWFLYHVMAMMIIICYLKPHVLFEVRFSDIMGKRSKEVDKRLKKCDIRYRVVFYCSALKMTKCQPLKEISELFLPKND